MTVEMIKDWLECFSLSIIENQDYLNQLDTPIGDGDHGSNMAKGADEALLILQTDIVDSSDLLKRIAMAFITKVGGASGPLYGSAFLSMSSEVDWLPMIQSGFESLIHRGKAQVGEKTMVDMWDAFLQEQSVSSLDLAVKRISEMKATKGRASYVGERSIGHMDPGSQSSYYLFNCLLKVIK